MCVAVAVAVAVMMFSELLVWRVTHMACLMQSITA
jgi:hypothetical protein